MYGPFLLPNELWKEIVNYLPFRLLTRCVWLDLALTLFFRPRNSTTVCGATSGAISNCVLTTTMFCFELADFRSNFFPHRRVLHLISSEQTSNYLTNPT
jgi:hypothetical protein